MNTVTKEYAPPLQYSEISSEQANKLLSMQSEIMELVILNHEHHEVLDKLCKMAENLVPNAVASIMLFNESGTGLYVRAAPSLPNTAIQALNGIEPGEQNGSCANAVFHNQPQFISDTLTDPRWYKVRQFAHDFNVGACWSMPIRLQLDKAYGSLALSSFETRQPSEFQKLTLETSAYIAGIIFKQQQEEKQLRYLAHYDQLTDLPNRSLLKFRLEHAINQAFRNGEKLALLYLDLDQFKEINDSQGHLAGDKVLQQVAQRIQKCIREEDTLARVGGDEFIILIERITETDISKIIAEKIIQQFSRPFHINDHEHLISTSIGISIYPNNGMKSDSLMQNADTAMYEAKARGKACYVYFHARYKQAIDHRISLTSELRTALKLQEFNLYYQPQFDCHTNAMNGAEVLVRWQHPNKGTISPNEFIPLAEQTGLIRELGRWIIANACKQCKQWWDNGLPQFILSINISIRQLQKGFAEELEMILQQHDFSAKLLEIEITESLVMDHTEIALHELKAIKNLGIGIAMDDFGTGHSSLAQLKHLPISKLKIDQSFVQGIPEDINDQTIAKTIISMSKTLDLQVIAEGVETKAQHQFFKQHGCDLVQGFLLSKPLPASRFEAFLQQTQ